jgi:WD40 repeat protein
MNDQQIRDAFNAVADAPGDPDETAAWTRISTAIEAGDARRRRLRTMIATATLGAGAAAALVVLAGLGDDREAVEVVPADPPTTTVPESEPTVSGGNAPAGPRQPVTMPEHPMAVVVSVPDGPSRLDLYDADTRQLVVAGLASSFHSISEVSFGSDGAIYFTEESGDSHTVRSVRPDSADPPATPFDAGDETRSPALSPDGSTFAYVHQGITAPEARIGLVDTATGERRFLDWAADEDRFAATSAVESLEWSPDGSRLLFTVSDEAPVPVVLDAEASSLSEAQPFDIGAYDVHWVSDDEFLALEYCCLPDFSQPRRLLLVNATSGEPAVVLPGDAESPDDPYAFDIDSRGLVAYVADGSLVLRSADGTEENVPVGPRALDVAL